MDLTCVSSRRGRLLPMQSVYVSAVGYKIGMEASGVVTAVGKNVKHLKVRPALSAHG